MPRLFKILVLFTVLSVCEKIFALPNDIEKCKMDDEKCLVKSANKVLKRFHGGISEIDLAPLDPFYVDYIKIVQDAGIVKVRASANNTNILGFSKGKIDKFTGFNKDMPEIHIKASKLSFSGKYASIANVLGLSINGRGTYSTVFNDFNAHYKLNVSRYEENGKTYFKVNNSKLTFTISGGSLDIPDLGYLTNAFLNASFDVIIKTSLINAISEAWSKFFEKTIADVMKKVAIEDLFLA